MQYNIRLLFALVLAAAILAWLVCYAPQLGLLLAVSFAPSAMALGIAVVAAEIANLVDWPKA